MRWGATLNTSSDSTGSQIKAKKVTVWNSSLFLTLFFYPNNTNKQLARPVTMVHYGFSVIIALVLASTLAEAQRYMGKREADRDYYTLNIPEGDKISAQAIAQQLGVRFEGNVGELDTWYMLSSAQQQRLQKRDEEEDRILKQFHHMKSLGLQKRDGHWQKAKSMEKQVLKKRFKRGPIPRAPVPKPADILADAQKELKMEDPWFPKQWHLVR
jgi:kexin